MSVSYHPHLYPFPHSSSLPPPSHSLPMSSMNSPLHMHPPLSHIPPQQPLSSSVSSSSSSSLYPTYASMHLSPSAHGLPTSPYQPVYHPSLPPSHLHPTLQQQQSYTILSPSLPHQPQHTYVVSPAPPLSAQLMSSSTHLYNHNPTILYSPYHFASTTTFSPPINPNMNACVIKERSRPTSARPVYKLSVQLMETYSGINDRYYASKRKRQQEKQAQLQKEQQAQQQAAAAHTTVAASSAGPAASVNSSSSYQSSSQPPLSSSGIIPLRTGETNDGYSDREWNYIVTENELLKEGRYQVQHSIGKGSFGRVVKAYDHLEKRFVAIKVVKAKSAFLKQAQIEMKLLNSVAKGTIRNNNNNGTGSGKGSPANEDSGNSSSNSSAAPSPIQSEGDKWNIVTMLDSFMHHNHQCIVFELLSLNLYELLRNTRFTGISLKLISKFCHQLLMTLAYLSSTERGEERIIHCDLKPENILLRKRNSSAIKVIDLGSACFAHQKVYTYIQSRFYRAPEVILGLSYNSSIDMWSLGAILFELCVGTPLFDGADEHDQLIRHVDLLGMPPDYMIEKSKKCHKFFTRNSAGASHIHHYNPNGWYLIDPLTVPGASASAIATYTKLYGNRSVPIVMATPLEKLKKRLGSKYQDTPLWNAFCDLILQMLIWDPRLRLKPVPALSHHFWTALKEQTVAAMQQTAAAQTQTPTTLQSTQQLSAMVITPATTNGTQPVPVTQPVAWPSLEEQTKSTLRVSEVVATSSVSHPATEVVAASALVASQIVTQSNVTTTTIASSQMDVTMSDVQPTSADVIVLPTDSQGSHSMEVEVSENDRKAGHQRTHRAPQPSTSSHITPTRKRHSHNAPHSPSSAQATPKTRALAAPIGGSSANRNLFGATAMKDSPMTRSASNLMMQSSPSSGVMQSDTDLETIHLPASAYKSPSHRPLPRSLNIPATRSSGQRLRSNSGAVDLAKSVPDDSAFLGGNSNSNSTVGSSTQPLTPLRRRSENLHDKSSITGQGGVLTRAQKNALYTPPSGPCTPLATSGFAHSSAAAQLERELTSDPLALHLDVPKHVSFASNSALHDGASHSLNPSSLAVFASPHTLRKRSGVTTRRQRAQLSEKERRMREEVEANLSQESDGEELVPVATRRLTRGMSSLLALQQNERGHHDTGSVHPLVTSTSGGSMDIEVDSCDPSKQQYEKENRQMGNQMTTRRQSIGNNTSKPQTPKLQPKQSPRTTRSHH